MLSEEPSQDLLNEQSHSVQVVVFYSLFCYSYKRILYLQQNKCLLLQEREISNKKFPGQSHNSSFFVDSHFPCTQAAIVTEIFVLRVSYSYQNGKGRIDNITETWLLLNLLPRKFCSKRHALLKPERATADILPDPSYSRKTFHSISILHSFNLEFTAYNN